MSTRFGLPLDVRDYLGALDEAELDCQLYAAPAPPAGADPAQPFGWGDGPVTCSTNTALVKIPVVIIDANGYYTELGIRFPFRPSKGQLRRAYQDRGGPDSVRLTYILTQLLRPGVRRAYDATPVGDLYADAYLRAQLTRHLSAQQLDILAQRGLLDDDVDAETDCHDQQSQDPTAETHSDHAGPQWGYSYFLWRCSVADVDLLASWQQQVITACVTQGLAPRRIAVGLHACDELDVVALRHVEHTLVVFVHHQATDLSVHAARAARLLQDGP